MDPEMMGFMAEMGRIQGLGLPAGEMMAQIGVVSLFMQEHGARGAITMTENPMFNAILLQADVGLKMMKTTNTVTAKLEVDTANREKLFQLSILFKKLEMEDEVAHRKDIMTEWSKIAAVFEEDAVCFPWTTNTCAVRDCKRYRELRRAPWKYVFCADHQHCSSFRIDGGGGESCSESIPLTATGICHVPGCTSYSYIESCFCISHGGDCPPPGVPGRVSRDPTGECICGRVCYRDDRWCPFHGGRTPLPEDLIYTHTKLKCITNQCVCPREFTGFKCKYCMNTEERAELQAALDAKAAFRREVVYGLPPLTKKQEVVFVQEAVSDLISAAAGGGGDVEKKSTPSS